MESRNLEEQLDACATVRSLAELIDIILAEAAHPPVQTRASFGWPRLRDHILREIQPMVLIAAGRVARLQNVVESLPAGEGDPVERLVQLRQWCARSEQPAETVKGESRSDEEIGSPATVRPAVSCGCKEPSRIDNQAYLLYTSMGISQEGVAAKLTEKYHPLKPYQQYQVARMVNRVREYRRANGLPVDQSRPSGSHIAGDPAVFELGNRTDAKVGDPRHKRSQAAE